MNKKGFIFVETIIVITIVLSSLLIVYSLYSSSLNQENKRLRYDDISKVYETYYIKKYLETFELDTLKNNIKDDVLYQNIYAGQSDLFGGYYNNEKLFFENMWNELHIQAIYLTTYDVSDMCDSGTTRPICSDRNLVNYLDTLDNGESEYNYRLIISFAQTQDGKGCSSNTRCFYYYSQVGVI